MTSPRARNDQAYDAAESRKAEQLRRAACFEELVASLRECCVLAEEEYTRGSAFVRVRAEMLARAHAVLAKAEGR